MITLILTTILITTVFFLIRKLMKRYTYWTIRGVKQRKQIYILGDNASIFFKKESFFEMMVNLYRTFPEERYIGMYQGMLPTLLVRDPEIIKQITVKEFDRFLNHRSFIPDSIEPLWSRNLIVLKDAAWRDMRSALSPSFTSNKMKIMFSLMTDCSNIYIDYFLKQGKKINMELKGITTRFTNDVIASAAFGIKCDSINEKENDFYMMGDKLISLILKRNVRFFLYSIAPRLCEILKLRLFPIKTLNFFVKIIKEAIHMRETQGIVRPDMINQLLEARKGKVCDDSSTEVIDTGFATVQESSIHTTNNSTNKKLSDLDIAAQALVFFFAGFDSVATLMSFLGYELAVNPDIQQKLQNEIDDT
ncbi:cytochrome P450, partial [Oryctes borbonicus]